MPRRRRTGVTAGDEAEVSAASETPAVSQNAVLDGTIGDTKATRQEKRRAAFREAVERRRVGAKTRAEVARLRANWLSSENRIAAELVRAYVRSVMLPDTVKRLFEIGMGRTQFTGVTMFGDFFEMEAPAHVQVAALKAINEIGVPAKLGTGDAVPTLPGVFALPESDLEDARGILAKGQYMGSNANKRLPRQALNTVLDAGTEPRGVKLSDDVERAIEAGDMEVIEVEDGDEVVPSDDRDPPPVRPASQRLTPEQLILARRRRRNGSNGTNGNGKKP